MHFEVHGWFDGTLWVMPQYTGMCASLPKYWVPNCRLSGKRGLTIHRQWFTFIPLFLSISQWNEVLQNVQVVLQISYKTVYTIYQPVLFVDACSWMCGYFYQWLLAESLISNNDAQLLKIVLLKDDRLLA